VTLCQFFQPVRQSTNETSDEHPRKRRRLSPVDTESKGDIHEMPDDALSIYDGENDELEQEGCVMLDDDDAEAERPPLQGREARVWIDVASSSSSGSDPVSTHLEVAFPQEETSSASHLANRTSADLLETESLDCPVCNQKIQTTNQGLNEHIDYCLSRSAIREAQAVANAGCSTPTKGGRKDKSGSPSHKPPSSKGKQAGKKGASKTSGQGLLQWARKEPARKAS
jgi:DNA polymerase kappa